MNIGSLFIQIGLEGANEVLKGLGGVKNGMGAIKDSSLAAKAAVLAVVYGVERLTYAAGEHGTKLVAYNAFTGRSIEGLQKWGNAFRQVGVDVDEVQGTIEGLQASVAKLKLGDAGVAKAFGYMGAAGVPIDQSQMNNPEYMLEQAIRYSKIEKDVGRRNQVLAMLGFSPNMIQGAVRGIFDEAHKAMGGGISEREADRLNKVKIAWDNIWQSLKMISEHQVAKNGIILVHGVEDAIKTTTQLANAIHKLAEEFPVLQKVAIVAGTAIALSFGPIYTTVAAIIAMLALYQENEKQLAMDAKTHASTGGIDVNAPGGKEKYLQYISKNKPEEKKYYDDMMKLMAIPGDIYHGYPVGSPPLAEPTQKRVQGAQTAEKPNLDVTLNFNQDVNDIQKTSDTVKAAVLSAYVKMPGFQNA